MDKLILLFVFASISVSPIYIFPSGVPQPADFLMVAAFCLFGIRMSLSSPTLIFLPGSLVGYWAWALIVSTMWAAIFSEPLFLLDVVFLSYNIFLFLLLVWVIERMQWSYRFISFAIIISLFVSTIGILIGFQDLEGRSVGFFNNPNQLAYFSICSLGAFVLVNKFRPPLMQTIIALTTSSMGVVSALSIGAVFGFLFILTALIIPLLKSYKYYIALIVGFSLFFVLLVYSNHVLDGALADGVEARLRRSESKFENIATERKYERITSYIEYTLLGAGTALHGERFPPYGSGEIHSTFGAIFFNYGVIGLVFFLAFLFRVMRGGGVLLAVLLMGPLVYSITHYGIRFSAFWLLMALAYCYKREVLRYRKSTSGKTVLTTSTQAQRQILS